MAALPYFLNITELSCFIVHISCENIDVSAYTKYTNVREMTNIYNYVGLIFRTWLRIFEKCYIS